MVNVPATSSSATPVVIFAVLGFLMLNIPVVGEVVFQWVPAALSVAVGTPISGDVRYTSDGLPVPSISVALEPVHTAYGESESQNTAFLAQAVSAFDAAVGGGSVYRSVSRANGISKLWSVFVPFSIFASLLLIVGIIYSAIQLMKIRAKERAVLTVTDQFIHDSDVTRAQLRWKKIIEHANTDNSNDWRHAIIEADIMLDELLSVQGYHGNTVGDKLKQVERSDFNSIDLAWEAHKVRNRIAHEGSSHDLNVREVRRVIALYEQVLHEFHYI